MIAETLGIPSDRTDLVILFSITLALVALTLLITIIQGVRKKTSTETWAIVFSTMLFVLILMFVMFKFSDVPSAAQIEERKTFGEVQSESSSSAIDENVTFEEIYYAYKENEIRANEAYQYNRYRVTAKINGMETNGLFNLTGGATLTMETKIGNTIVFFYAEFEKEQEEKLKAVNVGDEITFEGECLSAGTWTDCEIID